MGKQRKRKKKSQVKNKKRRAKTKDALNKLKIAEIKIRN
jgi:hypothetical protein